MDRVFLGEDDFSFSNVHFFLFHLILMTLRKGCLGIVHDTVLSSVRLLSVRDAVHHSSRSLHSISIQPYHTRPP